MTQKRNFTQTLYPPLTFDDGPLNYAFYRALRAILDKQKLPPGMQKYWDNLLRSKLLIYQV